jgi:hypothetical protein
MEGGGYAHTPATNLQLHLQLIITHYNRKLYIQMHVKPFSLPTAHYYCALL